MSNLTEALIAAKLMGNGGGGGGGGLPPITPGGGVVIYPEETLTFGVVAPNIYGAEMSDVTISADEDYTVIFDGVEYSNPPYTIVRGKFVFGNASVIGGGADTGEPFAISDARGALACFCAQGGTHTLAISQGEPQSPPDGSVLMVQNGAWAAAAIAGAGGIFYITPTYSGSTIVAVDHTFEEIKSAIDNGILPVIWYKYEGHRSGAVYIVSDVDVDYINFHTVQSGFSPSWIKINDDNTISQGS